MKGIKMKKLYTKIIVFIICATFSNSSVSYALPLLDDPNNGRDISQQAFLGRSNCVNAVSVAYIKPSYKIENHKNIQKFTKKKLPPKHKLGGQTRFSGLSWKIKDISTACGKKVEIKVQHRAPIRVIIPSKNSMLSCNYNAILKHEMEHVAIYRETPKEYEKKFKAILMKSSGASANQQLTRLSREISAEMKRRNDKFHDKNGAIYHLKRGCGLSG
jgi:hypothetical protein